MLTFEAEQLRAALGGFLLAVGLWLLWRAFRLVVEGWQSKELSKHVHHELQRAPLAHSDEGTTRRRRR